MAHKTAGYPAFGEEMHDPAKARCGNAAVTDYHSIFLLVYTQFLASFRRLEGVVTVRR